MPPNGRRTGRPSKCEWRGCYRLIEIIYNKTFSSMTRPRADCWVATVRNPRVSTKESSKVFSTLPGFPNRTAPCLQPMDQQPKWKHQQIIWYESARKIFYHN